MVSHAMAERFRKYVEEVTHYPVFGTIPEQPGAYRSSLWLQKGSEQVAVGYCDGPRDAVVQLCAFVSGWMAGQAAEREEREWSPEEYHLHGRHDERADAECNSCRQLFDSTREEAIEEAMEKGLPLL